MPCRKLTRIAFGIEIALNTQIKYLEFKGIDKKEQILFKSFLNLAKNELPYQVVILKEDYPGSDVPNIIIMDESYQFEETEASLTQLPTITIGDNIDQDSVGYIARPVQWSDFKVALSKLDIEAVGESEDAERVLPDEVKFAIEKEVTVDEFEDESEGNELISEDEFDYEFELENLSADYYSFTNSEYLKVAADVRKFQTDADDDDLEDSETMVLVTDDESGHENSVLVLETHSFDAWDYTESEITVTSVGDYDEDFGPIADQIEAAVPNKTKKGVEIDPDEEYWREDNEIIVDQQTLLWIKTARGMVYSRKAPGYWPSILQRGGVCKLPLRADWRPEKAFHSYPLSTLVWVNTLIRNTGELADGLEEDQKYILERWPAFDLLQLDNILLKLCTMLFVRPESAQSLASKSGYGRSTIIGLMNACHQMGLLVTPDKIEESKQIKASNDEGMLGRIRDVFR
ncbi:MAG: hypothetical protein HKN50_09620 [Gammaproteobacteria bacterium]|nr:hypothetical protein [Gammaproteobacteria bacterium]